MKRLINAVVILSAVMVVAVIYGNLTSEDSAGSASFEIRHNTEGRDVFLEKGRYWVRMAGDSVDIRGSNELRCNSTVLIMQVTDSDGLSIFEASILGERDRGGSTTGMRFEGRYYNEPRRVGGLGDATQTFVSESAVPTSHYIDIPETATYRTWGNARTLCKFRWTAERTQ